MLKNLSIAALLTATTLLSSATLSQAESLAGALAKAYQNSQSLNAARAQLRATDETVTQARAGLRPTVNGVGSLQSVRSSTTYGDRISDGTARSNSAGIGIVISQTLFDGFQTPNSVESAKAQVRAAQHNLANTEENTLLDAATAYMNVLRDRQIAALRRQNLGFLSEQVRAARARFEVGEGTRTDVAQAESQQALATALLNSALSQVASSEASYFEVIGDAPTDLAPGKVPGRVVPNSIASAFSISQREHPAILAGLASVDAAAFQVKVAEGRFLPKVTVSGRVDDNYSTSSSDGGNLPGVSTNPLIPNVSTQNEISATVGAQLTIPIYQGGQASSLVRQYKETLGQRRIEVDQVRDQVRAAVATAWAQLQAARANITGYQAQVQAARLALNGVIEERNVGQRTTLDVLNAQADVISAQILLVGSQRDEVVAGYSLLSAIGRLSAGRLRLAGKTYDPDDHYIQVEDKWYGLRTPDGR
ncbi:TolC family outer membrane protein [Aurantimonas sp. VKM B-3413]|uniref:TolC family outer membrane protein n=1 Tax=Aurantimonas sp. VKM B-3413 TaxID=2779401 RepID=UPI001E3CC1C5|nr:TolC family outer membrane protein [Aurantimonas sp. VKM B-3413]MCB8837128.1 TolC family outer membrane protein [Aurantimonas sp. VKM B-3413]